MNTVEKQNQELLTLLNAKFKYVEPQHLRELFGELVTDVRATIHKASDPDFMDQTLGPQPWAIQYRNRKHIFMYAITTFTATIGELGSVTFTAGNWYNISFRAGIPITPTNPTSVTVLFKFTDEIVP